MKTGVLVAAGAAALALGVADVAYRARQWGVYAREIALSLPGDQLAGGPTGSVTRGVTVHAPADEVWHYLFEAAGARDGACVVGERSLLLPGDLDGGLPVPVRTFHVLPVQVPRDAGRARCRLVTRTRTAPRGPLGRIAAAVLEPLTMLTTRRVLLAVKDRAEQASGWTAVTTG